MDLLLVPTRLSSAIEKHVQQYIWESFMSPCCLEMSQEFRLTGAGPGWLIFSHFSNKRVFDYEVYLVSFVWLSSAFTLFRSQIIYREFPIRYFKYPQIFCGLLTLCIFPLSFLNFHILAQFLFLEFTIWVRGFLTSSPPSSCEFCDFFFFSANTFTHSSSF